MIRKEAIRCRYCKSDVLSTADVDKSGEEEENPRLVDQPTPNREKIFRLTETAINQIFEDMGVSEAKSAVMTKTVISEPKRKNLTKLKNLLRKIDAQPGVLGSCFVDHNGTIRVDTLPKNYDVKTLGRGSLQTYLDLDVLSKKIRHNKVQQVIFQSNERSVIIVPCSAGLLIIVATICADKSFADLIQRITESME
jgi:hypothetical protein